MAGPSARNDAAPRTADLVPTSRLLTCRGLRNSRPTRTKANGFMFSARPAEQDVSHPGYRDAGERFERLVLQHGGRHVVPPLKPDPLIDLLTAEARVVDGASIAVRSGDPSECHRNAIALWRTGQCDAIATGYAPSPSVRIATGSTNQSRLAFHGKGRSSSARARTADSPKRPAHKLSHSSLSKKNFQSLITPCLRNRNGTGDWKGRKLKL